VGCAEVCSVELHTDDNEQRVAHGKWPPGLKMLMAGRVQVLIARELGHHAQQ
jgi:hypothetical protein